MSHHTISIGFDIVLPILFGDLFVRGKYFPGEEFDLIAYAEQRFERLTK